MPAPLLKAPDQTIWKTNKTMGTQGRQPGKLLTVRLLTVRLLTVKLLTVRLLTVRLLTVKLLTAPGGS